jgi:hypothetical protein
MGMLAARHNGEFNSQVFISTAEEVTRGNKAKWRIGPATM